MSKKLKTKFPKLRFPEFSDEWQSYKGADITSKITKGSSPSWQGFQYQKSGVLFVTSENVRDGLLDISEPKFVDKDFLQKQKNSQLLTGDILINIVGASIGRCCIYTINDIALINQAVAVFRVNNNHLNNFIAYCYQQSRIQKIISGTQSESARPNLSLGDLNNLVFILPEIAEQEKIASFFGALDTRLTQLRHKRELLQTYKRGVMQKIFSQKIRFPQPDGSPFPAWERKKLGELGEVIAGLTYSPSDVEKEGLLVLRSSNVQDGKLAFDDCVFVNTVVNSKSLSRESDILICVRNGSTNLIGKNALIPKNIPPSTHGAFMVIFRSNRNSFIFQLFQTDMYKRQVYQDLGARINSINSDRLRKYRFLIPCIEEQEKIANFLTTLDRKIETLSRQIDQTEQFKKGLLQKMFV